MYQYLIILFLLLNQYSLSAENTFRIVGYLPTYRLELFDEIEIEKLTHLNIAFAQLHSNGIFSTKMDILPYVQKAKSRNAEIEVYISLGGGLNSYEFSNWKRFMLPSNRTQTIVNLMSFLEQNQLDGIDMDLEWNNVTALYPAFCKELADSLKMYQYGFTAAFPATTLYDHLTIEDLQVFDFINVMAYDDAGPWRPSDARQHSSYNLAVNSLAFWTDSCQVDPSKINLGLPFYGYNFNKYPVKSCSFNAMVKSSPNLAYEDKVGKIYYNSIPTIIEKTRLAKSKCGGIMIWELGQDALKENAHASLLHYAYDTALRGDKNDFFPKKNTFRILDNSGDVLGLQLENQGEHSSYFLIKDIMGNYEEKVEFSIYTNIIYVDMNSKCRGIYTVTLIQNNTPIETQKIMHFSN